MSTDSPDISIDARTPRSGSAHPDALEFVADLLIGSVDPNDEYPAYTEDRLLRRARRAGRGRTMNWSRYTCSDLLLSAEIDDLLRSARLAPDEDAAWRMTLKGHLPEEIAKMLGTSRTRVCRLIHSARSRVASCNSRSDGLYSVYVSLIHRHTYHPPGLE